ncbi:helix-turn-helix transcriptional regulator [Ideonella sp. 4Y16]|uniref:Helix-turn-helix transcriptional regulator n=1 Tax=Ideonella alba TaxID=2824118 RepID=A0A941BIZ5_9BURK|nr:metalloregulator ArsR/SmtB family transcription factor [Ideonella alba]MBQ0933258.1 helix-turn-helix transcriptional regulator [Ideonella alba]MBQ0944728.1 helix-turn-helix transcriptional regulator [Ideonella alba]
MDEQDVLRALAALAQQHRLRAFRALVVAGPDGLNPGVLAEALGIPPNTLSFHLKELSQAGLVQATRDGRSLVYRAAYERMDALLSFLTAHCCAGAADACCAAVPPATLLTTPETP